MLKNNLKNKKIIFAFSDSAGAKALLSIWKLNFDSLKNSILISDRYHNFYKSFESSVTIVYKVKEIENIVYDFNPDLLICGTSADKFELKCIQTCLQLNIKTISFVDHWTNFLERFRFNENRIIFPDKIWVIDDFAKNKAIDEGIDENKIVIHNNPYYEYLRNWKPSFSRYEVLKKLNLNQNSSYILFAPEPLKKYKLNTKYGFDEFDAAKELIKYFNDINEKFLIIKCHPNHDYKDFLKLISNNLDFKTSNVSIIDNNFSININELIYFSDSVLGLFSNSLIESNIIGKKTGQVLTKILSKKQNPIKNLNGIKKLYTKKDVLKFINDKII